MTSNVDQKKIRRASTISTRMDGVVSTLHSDDIGARFLATLDPAITEAPISAREARRLLWKIDLIVLPLISGTVILSAVDKIIISNAAVLGMRNGLHLVGDQYSWAGSIFYLGFLLFELPSGWMIQRFPVAKLLSVLVFLWAVMLFCTAAVQNFGGLATTRFLMGCAEAGAFPIASILTVMWYKKEEQPIRVAVWFNMFSTVFSGLVSYGIGHTTTSLEQWRLLFLVLGAFTVLWTITLLVLLPDSPTSAWYLSERERYICVYRLQTNNTGLEDKRFKWYQVRECLLDPKTWLLAVFACAQNIPNGGLITFAAIIVSGLGYNARTTMLLGIPTGVLGTVWQVILSVFCIKLKNYRCTVIAIANIVPMTCAILMWKLPRTNQHGLLAAYFVFYTYWGPYVMATSVPMANVSGHTKKVTMNAIYFLAYCVGNIVGPQCFRASDAPKYSKGYITLLACFVTASVAIILYGVLCWSENARRDRLADEGIQFGSAEIERTVFSDKTDKEKLDFRYTY